MNDEYQYEYDASIEPANGDGDDSGYRGFSAYMPRPQQRARSTATPLLSPSEDMARFQATTQYSDLYYTNPDLEQVIANYDKIDRVIVMSWDLAADPAQTGTIVRFEGRNSKFRSADFRFTIMRRNFQRNLKSNMDRVREEIDVELSGLDAHSLGGIERYSGATRDGAVQMIISTVGTDFVHAYLCLADQVIIPLVNKWTLTNNMDCYRLQQSITQAYSPAEMVQHIRGF